MISLPAAAILIIIKAGKIIAIFCPSISGEGDDDRCCQLLRFITRTRLQACEIEPVSLKAGNVDDANISHDFQFGTLVDPPPGCTPPSII